MELLKLLKKIEEKSTATRSDKGGFSKHRDGSVRLHDNFFSSQIEDWSAILQDSPLIPKSKEEREIHNLLWKFGYFTLDLSSWLEEPKNES